MDKNYLEIFFRYLGIIFFIGGLWLNYGEKHIPEAVLRFVRYGRANISKGKGKPTSSSSALMKIEVPKSWFGHFYLFTFICQSVIVFAILNAYGVFTFGTEIANFAFSVLTNVLLFFGGDGRRQAVNSTTTVLVTVLFLIHISRRLYETWFVSVYSGTKMNLSHYGLAFVHYSGTMLSLISLSPGFVSHIRGVVYTISLSELTIWSAIGVLLFVYGSIEQNRAHRGFANLRLGKNKELKSLAHRIPTGGLFDYISCPNYWGEIVIYIAFAVMMGFQNSTFNSVTGWVISNQVIGGIMNHLWYLKTFPDYPKNRKAIIPFIW